MAVLTEQIGFGISLDLLPTWPTANTLSKGILAMWHGARREFLKTAGRAAAGAAVGLSASHGLSQDERPRQDAGVTVLNPLARVPLSFIIDDSTCLVNMGHFCTPQFHACYPGREQYQKDWQRWPRELPDAFVREFGEWCAEHQAAFTQKNGKGGESWWSHKAPDGSWCRE